MSGVLETLVFMAALIVANGLFAAAEIAIVSVRKTRIRHLIEEGSSSAAAVNRLHRNPDDFLATVQIGITVVSALGAALGGAAVAEPLAALLRSTSIGPVRAAAKEIAFGIVVGGFSFVSILLGELIPKSLALRYSEPLALRVAPPMLALGTLARPLVRLLTGTANLVLKPFRDRTRFAETRLTPEEIKLLVDEAAESGTLERARAEIIERAVDFGELTVADVLVPRGDIVAIDLEATRDELRRIALEQGHTRMPVFEGTIDRIVGFITAKDIINLAWQGELVVLQDIVRPAFFVPQSMRAVELLKTLQSRHEHMAVVVDEYGGTAGICTTEDLVEEIVGEIFSEDSAVPEPIREEPGGTSLVLATLPVRDFNRAFDAELPEHDVYDTLAGMLTHLAGAIPAAGQVFRKTGFEFTVVERTERRVKAVRVRRIEEPREPQE